jgi:hypothetical protein
MPTATKRSRSVRLVAPIGTTTPGRLRIVAGKDATDYRIEHDGDEFVLSKLASGPERIEATYRVSIGLTPHCQCRAFEFRGRCRHVDAIRALRNVGRI